MRRRTTHALALLGAAALLALHLDTWRPQRAHLWFGWMPEELAWRLAWMAAAALYLVWFCSAVWRDDRA